MMRKDALSVAIMVAASTTSFAASPEQIIATFTGGDGSGLVAGLLADKSGRLYGESSAGGSGFGTVFMLTPPATGQAAWTVSSLYAFSTGAVCVNGGCDGAAPAAGPLAADNAGALYGTTLIGGTYGQGVVFKLAPSGLPPWHETVIHSFGGTAADGASPYAGVVIDKAGNVYGTTVNGGSPGGRGVAYQIRPPAAGQTAWTERVIHTFAPVTEGYPLFGLSIDPAGSLYGITQSGVVFMLTPPKAGVLWTPTVLYRAGGAATASLVKGANGAYFGSVAAGGVAGAAYVFALTPPQTGQAPWSSQDIYDFPSDDLKAAAIDYFDSKSGYLYGTDSSTGTVFQLSPPTIGQGKWTLTVLHDFHGGADGFGPTSGLIARGGFIYGTTASGGPENAGVVFRIKE